MPRVLDPQLKRALAERIRYYNELGIYDFYRRPATAGALSDAVDEIPEQREPMTPRNTAAIAAVVTPEENMFETTNPKPESRVEDPVKALRIIREDPGACTLCKLNKRGHS